MVVPPMVQITVRVNIALVTTRGGNMVEIPALAANALIRNQGTPHILKNVTATQCTLTKILPHQRLLAVKSLSGSSLSADMYLS